MQPGRGGRHGPFMGRIHGLVAQGIGGRVGPVQVGGEGEVAGRPQYLGKRAARLASS